MAKARMIKELLVETTDKIGMLAEITGILSKSGSNIEAMNAFGIGKKAYFRIVTENSKKASKALKAKGMKVIEKDAVKVSLKNEIGQGFKMSDKLKRAGINLTYIYGSTCSCGCDCDSGLIFKCSNNKKAVSVINK